ncbi:hypothetical protein K456DRAFT_54010 [Colletotrichum gloeosporioides 23]|nr:hypothetical protein K456DRAFT_54010 [Colletotrichum gloeosporioides 23]
MLAAAAAARLRGTHCSVFCFLPLGVGLRIDAGAETPIYPRASTTPRRVGLGHVCFPPFPGAVLHALVRVLLRPKSCFPRLAAAVCPDARARTKTSTSPPRPCHRSWWPVDGGGVGRMFVMMVCDDEGY